MIKNNSAPIVIFGESIIPGESKTINVEIARLHTTTKLNIPVIVRRSKIDGPVVLFSAGIHGDEINYVNCRSLWKDSKGRIYRVEHLKY